MKRKLKFVAFVVAVALLGLTILNASWLAPSPVGSIRLIAHRGIAQQFPRAGVDNETCTATQIEPPIHDRLENTVRSIEDSPNQGADMVEVDVAPTSDGKIVLFHDWTLDCRTDGSGPTRDRTLAELKALDIGHGYSADGGKTFPFRGQRKYTMPTLEEGLAASPYVPLMFNFKSKDPAEADRLAAALKAAGRDVARIGDAFYGAQGPVTRIRQHFPSAWAWSKEEVKACTTSYMVKGWVGIVPEECRNRTFVVPLNYQWMVPGWPNRALARFKASNTKVIVTGPRTDEGMAGLELPEQLGEVPSSYKGYLWVEDIWTVGPAFRSGKDLRNQAQLDASEAALELRRAGR